MLIKALLPYPSVESFNERIVCRFSWPAEGKLNAMPMCPIIQRLGHKFRSVVDIDNLWQPMYLRQTFENPDYARAWKRKINFNGWTLTGHVIHYRYDPESATIIQAIRHKIHAPMLIWHMWWWLYHAQRTNTFLACLEPQRQTLLPVEPVHPLVVDMPTLALQQDVQAAVAIPDAYRSKLP